MFYSLVYIFYKLHPHICKNDGGNGKYNEMEQFYGRQLYRFFFGGGLSSLKHFKFGEPSECKIP